MVPNVPWVYVWMLSAAVAMNDDNAMEALFPGPRRLVLCAVFHEPERWWSLAELAGRAGIEASSLRRHVSALRRAGIIREKQESGRCWFQADSGCPVFAELKGIVNKLTSRSGAAETILVVEDQPATAQITRILLESWGYHVIEVHSGAEAVCAFEDQGDGIHLLLTDVIMPGLTGPQVAAELQRRNPDLRVVFMSGYSVGEIDQPGTGFLPKPFNPASLSRMVRKELDRPTRSARSARNMKTS
jgi:CheY-like chemotaxis protein